MNEALEKETSGDPKDGDMNVTQTTEKNEVKESQQGGAGNGIGGQNNGNTSGLHGKKRVKASRACDQCRRRKIKCDYNEDKGICTSCSKNGEKCLFERVPLKRGPSKGYTKSDSRSRSQSISSDVGHGNNGGLQELSSPSSRVTSVLLPPLAQYLPQSNTAPLPVNNNAPNGALGQQQFWKVPYHEFNNSRRGSIDSLQSDLSIKNLNAPNDQQLLYSTPTGSLSHGFQSPSTITHGVASNDQRTPYWSLPNRASQSSAFSEEVDEYHRKPSFPPVLRNASNSSITNHLSNAQPLPPSQQQTLYPYSQFSQQRPTINSSISSFNQFGSNGYQSRQGSIASESMSPSAPLLFQPSVNQVQTNANTQVTNNNEEVKKQQQPYDGKRQSVDIQQPIQQSIQQTPEKSHVTNKSSDSTKETTKETTKKRRKRGPSHRRSRSSTSNVSVQSNNSSLSYKDGNISSSISDMNCGVIYGQISDVDLIDTYYEFIHTGFPIIPLNKKTLTNEVLLVNTQPISAIHEVNNYVIVWFRNSLELLIRVSLKKRYNHFFDGNGMGMAGNNIHNSDNSNENAFDRSNDNDNDNDSNDNNSNNKMNSNNIKGIDDESLEIKGVFINALNECLQKIVDVHPRFREIKQQISPKIKIIYLSTFIALNYILAIVGYDNSFVLGMSVTIFKEFKIHELLLFDTPDDNTYQDDSEADNIEIKKSSIIFKRLYVLLIIFDSLQSCLYGGPKLINIPIHNTSNFFFETEDPKWTVDESPNRMKCILKSLKLGELINEIAMNRRSICDYNGENLIWLPKAGLQIKKEENEIITLTELFHDFLIIKIKITNDLLTLRNDIEQIVQVSDYLCGLISLALNTLTLLIKLNPTNRIDYNFRPIEESQEQRPSKPESSSQVHGNNQGNEIYQRLLGLQTDKRNEQSNVLRGVVSPYCVCIIDEISNVIKLVKQLPTSLIGLIVQNTMVTHPTIKPQDLIVNLSNSMNDMMTVTSLLNMIKPLKLRDQQTKDLSTDIISRNNNSDSVMERLYRSKGARYKKENIDVEIDSTNPPDNKKDNLKDFISVGWKLLDDLELGWC